MSCYGLVKWSHSNAVYISRVVIALWLSYCILFKLICVKVYSFSFSFAIVPFHLIKWLIQNKHIIKSHKWLCGKVCGQNSYCYNVLVKSHIIKDDQNQNKSTSFLITYSANIYIYIYIYIHTQTHVHIYIYINLSNIYEFWLLLK